MAILMQRFAFGDVDDGTFVDNDGDVVSRGDGSFWYSPKAEIIKWAIAAGIVVFFIMWFVGGYYHAQRRVKKGLKPLRYHNFLLPRSQRAKFEPQNNFSFYRQNEQGYRMESYAPPPPVYDPNLAAPPGYGPPQGASKINPTQDWIAPPPGAPPGRSTTPDVEQGLPSEPLKAEPTSRGGLLHKIQTKIPKLPFGR